MTEFKHVTVNCPSVEWHNCTFASLGINKSPVVIPLLKHYGFFIGIKKKVRIIKIQYWVVPIRSQELNLIFWLTLR